VQRKPLLVIVLILSLMLSGCAGTLPLAEGLPTATPGFAPQEEPASEPSQAEQPPDEQEASPEPPEQPVDVPAEPVPDVPAPEPVVEAPAAEPGPVDPAFANVQLPAPADLEARWRDMQVERVPFEPTPYVSSGWEMVWWYDPLFGQFLPIGQVRGEFTVQARFRVKGQWVTALEMPYHVGQQYDITVPDAILQRMRDAGKGEWAEVFVFETNDVRPK
jgi:hypothetical protein